ncbi:MAG: plastocyanin/azurin family copper-binding protein [Myxococcota bacterium]
MRLTCLSMWMLVLACSEEPPPPKLTPKPPPDYQPPPQPDAKGAADADDATANVPMGAAQQKDTRQEAGTTLSLGTDGDRMAFDKTELTATAGLIRLTFQNQATVAAMQHNVVFTAVDSGDRIGTLGIGAGPEAHYVPDDERVLAATPLIGPGESSTIVMKLSAGVYEYVCTFPGHYLQMKGTLRVTP